MLPQYYKKYATTITLIYMYGNHLIVDIKYLTTGMLFCSLFTLCGINISVKSLTDGFFDTALNKYINNNKNKNTPCILNKTQEY